MPILERDPWRFQYFTQVPCPDDVNIPTDDPDCWTLYPHFRWIYEKLRIAKSQGLDAAPHSFMPERYPVFSKPNINLKGMGVGSRPISSDAEMREHYKAGHMWMSLLEGEHISSDCAIVDGSVKWIRHATGIASRGGMFEYWKINAAQNAALELFLSQWVAKHMVGYTGMMNFETIAGYIIEAHLRFADQWPDLYGAGWVQALVQLYATKQWVFADDQRRDGFSIPLFAKHGFQFRHPSQKQQDEVLAMKNITSLQITFHEANAASSHAMPPGGFRLAIVNAMDLPSGLAARAKMRSWFPKTQLIAEGQDSV